MSNHYSLMEQNSELTELELGRINLMPIVRKVDFGYYLEGTIRGERIEVLMPMGEVDTSQGEPLAEGSLVSAFLYLDQEERLVASMKKPLAQVGDFAFLEVAWVNNFGAFLHWGPLKDLFVPFREQKMKMQKGQSYIVHLHIDSQTYRIMASAKVERYLDTEHMPPYHEGDEVSILVWQKSDLGLKAIVDNRFGGLLYEKQLFRQVRTGDRLKAYVSKVRPDGKIDLMLQRPGQEAVHDFSSQLLDYLQTHNGHIPLGDKSPAEDIYDIFGVSKKVFKKAVGDLYKQRLINLQDNGITLIKDNNV